jgi:hypothetical protein
MQTRTQELQSKRNALEAGRHAEGKGEDAAAVLAEVAGWATN